MDGLRGNNICVFWPVNEKRRDGSIPFQDCY